MTLQKQCEEVLKNIDHSSVDSIQESREKILKLLSKYGSDPYVGTAVFKVSELKEEADALIQKEEEQKKNEIDNKNIITEMMEKTDNLENSNNENQERKSNDEQNQQKQLNLPDQNQEKNADIPNQSNQSNETDQINQSSKCCLLI